MECQQQQQQQNRVEKQRTRHEQIRDTLRLLLINRGNHYLFALARIECMPCVVCNVLFSI